MLHDASDVVIAGIIAGIIADAERRNLRNYRDPETRFWAARSSTARAIRRERKAAGQWAPTKNFPPACV